MISESPAEDIRNALMILNTLEFGLDPLDAIVDRVKRRLQAALSKLKENEPELEVCSGCHEHAPFYIVGNEWFSECCNKAPINPDIEPEKFTFDDKIGSPEWEKKIKETK